MKCYICKKNINISTRVFVIAKNKRERSQFRDLCDECYEKHMHSQGYMIKNGVWKK